MWATVQVYDVDLRKHQDELFSKSIFTLKTDDMWGNLLPLLQLASDAFSYQHSAAFIQAANAVGKNSGAEQPSVLQCCEMVGDIFSKYTELWRPFFSAEIDATVGQAKQLVNTEKRFDIEKEYR